MIIWDLGEMSHNSLQNESLDTNNFFTNSRLKYYHKVTWVKVIQKSFLIKTDKQKYEQKTWIVSHKSLIKESFY